MANRFLSNIRINDAYTFPASDGSNGQVIVTDGSGNLAFANPATSSSASIIYRDNFTGDGSTVAFTLQNSLSDEDQTFIYIDGVYQEKGTYSLSTNTITFTTAPDTGHSIEVISVSGINVGPTTIYQDNFTGDGTTTNFTLAQVIDNEVKTMIYFNGVYQFKGTYSLNGTALSFDTAPANGVDIEVISIASAAAADYNQKVLFYGKANEAISKGDAIMLAGQEGDHFLLAKATQAAIAANHEYFLGLASQDLVQGEFGYVTEFGKITELDTSGYTAGDILWFDAGGSTAGALTTTEPAPPLVKIQVASVIRSHANEGVLFIRPSWYHELGELHDVNVTSVADKDMLVWDNTNGYWENSKTLGDITATSLAVDTDTLYVDAVNNRVGIGTTSPNYNLEVYNGDVGATDLYLKSITNSNVRVQGVTTGDLDIYNNSTHRAKFSSTGDFWLYGNSNIKFSATGDATIGNYSGTGTLSFITAAVQRMFIDLSGNVGIAESDPSGYWGQAHNLVLTDSNTGLTIKSSTAGNGRIVFTDTKSTTAGLSDGGMIHYSHTSDSMQLHANGAERMRINSTGNIGIDTSSPNRKFVVSNSGANGVEIDPNISGVSEIISYNRSTSAYTQLNIQASEFQHYANEHNWYSAGSFAMRLKSNGYLGIGTTSPTQKLDVQGNELLNGSLYLGNTTTRISSDGSGEVGINYNSGNTSTYSLSIYNSYSRAIGLGRTGDAFFSGSVGIGTTSPSAKLDVYRGSSGVVANFNGVNAYGAETGITLSQGRAKISGFLNTTGGTPGSNLAFYTMLDNSSITERMRINSNGSIQHNFNPGDGSNFWRDTTNGAVMFYLIPATYVGTAPYNANRIVAANSSSITLEAGGAERITIVNDGEVILNGTQGSSTNPYPLRIEAGNGGVQAKFTRSGAYADVFMGGTTTTGTQLYIRSGGLNGVRLDYGATSWTSASDVNLKNINHELTGILSKLHNIRAVNFSWKEDESNAENLGVIAQDVEAEFPQLVTESDIDGMKGVKYSEFIPVLIAAIKEQQAIIEDLKARIQTLENN